MFLVSTWVLAIQDLVVRGATKATDIVRRCRRLESVPSSGSLVLSCPPDLSLMFLCADRMD